MHERRVSLWIGPDHHTEANHEPLTYQTVRNYYLALSASVGSCLAHRTPGAETSLDRDAYEWK